MALENERLTRRRLRAQGFHLFDNDRGIHRINPVLARQPFLKRQRLGLVAAKFRPSLLAGAD